MVSFFIFLITKTTIMTPDSIAESSLSRLLLLTGLGQWTCHEHQSEVVEHLPEVYISQMICNCSKPPNRYVYENTSESVVCLSKWSSLYTLLFCVYSVNIQANDLITNKDLENNRLYFSINVKNIEMHIIGVFIKNAREDIWKKDMILAIIIL